MKILQAAEDLAAPRLDHARVDLLEPFDVCLERAGRHQLGHHDEALSSFGILIFPGVVESDDVGMLESFQHLGFFLETLTLFAL